ncbi:MAG: hypothetical protein HY589_00275 [Candidatus Omnitrophica bacterium]|nr:hypothetical protein [Candidatus Omnitrophota bacterium]
MTLIKKLDRLLKFIVLKVTKAVKIEFACIYIDGRNADKLIQKFPYTTAGLFPRFPLEIPYDSNFVSYLKQHKRPVFAEELSEGVKKELNLRAGIIIPSFVRSRLLGFLVMGPKSSGAIYSLEDAMVFRILSAQVGLAIENTQFLKEFEEAQAKLREAEKLKGIAQMMHSLNHELNNIFNKIMLPLSLIVMGVIPRDDKNRVDDALNAINKSVEMGAEILKYVSNYYNRSKSDTLGPKTLEDAINNAVAEFQERFKGANINITTQIQPELPIIHVKETFDDLFINILANSYFVLTDKAQGDRLINLQARLSQDRAAVQIHVSDTGPDMSRTGYMQDKDSPFQERGKIGGVNLGLAHLIVHDHNGKLTYKSYEKGGTTFIITLPISQNKIP